MTRIAVLGAGGIGGSIGAYLTRAGQDVTLIDQWAAHIEAMKRDGLTLTDLKERFTIPVKALHLHEVSTIWEPFDIVFLSVKSYDTVWSTHLIAPHVAPWGMVLPAMNALNDEPVAQVVGYSRTVGCVTTISAGVYEPGHIVRTDPMTTHAFSVGELSGLITNRVRQVVDMLRVIGPSEATGNIWGARWSKLLWNSMGNAMSGLLGEEGARLTAEQYELDNLIRVKAGQEGARIALTIGVTLEPVTGMDMSELAAADTRAKLLVQAEAMARARAVRHLTPEQIAHLGQPGRPSLQQDVLKGRRTEVDYLNGALVSKGRELGIPTPMNQAIVELTHRVERGEMEPGAHVLERLAPYLPA
ncbi:MAG: 2-dehydropantoate 2-reductase [Chloroflexi bacterium]|nr:2-dehydropantoate 2-reductase [Chloroflexota bacterium]